MWVTVTPFAVPPSPNDQEKTYGAVPPLAEPVNETVCPVVGLFGVKLNVGERVVLVGRFGGRGS